MSTIFPASGDGTSIAAFSDSRTINGSSAEITSPFFTQTSITSTSFASPRSGTCTIFFKLHFPWIWLIFFDA